MQKAPPIAVAAGSAEGAGGTFTCGSELAAGSPPHPKGTSAMEMAPNSAEAWLAR
jgi:hypothetical protein